MDVETKTKILKKTLPMLLLAVSFSFWNGVSANDCRQGVVISEVYGGGGNQGAIYKNDFIELYNNSESDVDLTDWKVEYASVSGSFTKNTGLSGIIRSGKYYLVQEAAGSGGTQDLPTPNMVGTMAMSATSGKVRLVDDRGDIVDSVEYSGINNNSTSFSRNNNCDTDHSSDFEKTIPSPKSFIEENGSDDGTVEEDSENGEEEGNDENQNEEIEIKICTDGIFLNEIFPYPPVGGTEFVEVINKGSEICDLFGWRIEDLKGNKAAFGKNQIIIPDGYSYVEKNMGLNSDEETVYLKYGNVIKDEASYEDAKRNLSYSLDGKKWRLSEETKGKKNIFSDNPASKTDIPEKGFVKTYTDFEVEVASKDSKVTWNFGDGHKSYKAKTRHKYEKIGEYKGSVKVSGKIEDEIKHFSIKIEKYPHPDVSISAVNPNPIGKDSELETITIKNKSKKKIDLLGWSVATGWDKLVNHPIRESLEIKPGKEKELTRDHSAFSLNNKKAKIELRYPDGEVAYELKYKEKDNIKEGVTYVKKKGGGWEWKNGKSVPDVQSEENVQIEQIQQPEPLKQINAVDIGKLSEYEIADIFELTSEYNLEVPTSFPDAPRILGARSLWIDENNMYRFTQVHADKSHYAASFVSDISTDINAKLNLLLNYYQEKRVK